MCAHIDTIDFISQCIILVLGQYMHLRQFVAVMSLSGTIINAF